MIVSGVQEGLAIAARLFLARGALGVVEDPCYQGAASAFEASGAEVASVAVDRDGLIADRSAERTTSLLYLTPSHQYPTGGTLSAGRRDEIIAWARRYGCYVLEDDYDCDIRYEGSHLPPIAALAPDCTIYLGTFSKSLGGGLRLGYMVVPGPIAEAVRSEKCLLNNGNPWLEQATLADFMRTGSYAAHLLRRARALQGEPRLSRGRVAPQFRRRRGRGRQRRAAPRLVSAARHSGRRDGGGNRTARAGRRLFASRPPAFRCARRRR